MDLPSVRKLAQPQPQTALWWDYARRCAHALWAGDPPPTLKIYGPLLAPGESALLCTTAVYSRFVRGDGAYTPASVFAFGRPAMLVGALAVQGFVNRRRKAAAQHEAVPKWRWQQPVDVIVTTHRLLCNCCDRGWQSFWFCRVTEFYPDLEHWTLTMGFGGAMPPLRLTGPTTPALSLWSAWAVLGRQWSSDPRLAALLE